jgi:DNA-binding NarL/FixJ family response regulator
MKIAPAVSPSLLLLDDNPALLETLVEMLAPNHTIVAALSNGVSLLSRISLLDPDILILDISLGDLSGFEVAKCLRDRRNCAKIMFLSVHEDIDFVAAAFDIGAYAYVFKSRIFQDLTNAIAVVFGGGRFVSPTSGFSFEKQS